MRRLRARLARSDLDQEVMNHLVAAERQVRAALAVCDKARRTEGIEAHRARRTRRDLLRVLGAMEAVGRLTPIRDELAEVPRPVVRKPEPEPPPTLPDARPGLPLGPAEVT
jgi:hypothetical protein